MLFQKNILKKYITAVSKEEVEQAWNKYQSYFLNPDIQANIMQSKEEQFQEGFLRELFVKVLGYTLNPSPDYNLITEQKNETNSKKADGAILVDGTVVGVIELKDHKTTDLSKIEQQAFGYKNQNQNAVYVVISNFEKLRFYIDNAVEHIEFDLFHLSEDDFRILWLCLAYKNIAANLPKLIKNESVSNEDTITNSLYKDYSLFKRMLFADIVEHNPTYDKLLLFKKTQKLLDRLLFIFFAEDGGLLPPNSMIQIIDQWEKLKEMDEYRPFYDRVKKYFGYMNTGFKGQKYEIFAYNGGLFKPDEVLDNILISDEVLLEHTKRLSTYDYESEVDVNILGHIFENSLSEIEEVTQQINGGKPSQTSKRKKDGVFYTPQYITKYIVQNTVGKLCNEKKKELQIVEDEYFADKNRQIATKKVLKEKLDSYREWLLGVSICDPACGSGAFLNAALSFLMAEHRLIDEMEAKLTGSAIVFQNVENSILENNLYGVDINEESVEIAKLSIWLRTAKPHRKLTSLNNNIKCGNSLISDPAVAGDKAFDWQKEFPEVFAKGGFDVVIGNPPYVQLQSMGAMSDVYAHCGYESYNKSGDLYCLFYEQGCKLLKSNGILGFIASNKWLKVNYGTSLRKYLTTAVNPYLLVDFPGVYIFSDATVDPQILLLSKESYKGKTNACICNNVDNLESFVENHKIETSFNESAWVIPNVFSDILNKVNHLEKLKDKPITINYGIKTGYNEAFFIDGDTRHRLIDEDPNSAKLIRPLLRGRDIQAWMPKWEEQYLITTFPSLQLHIDNYPAIKNFLLSFGIERLEQSGMKGARKKTSNKWFETQDTIVYYPEFSKPKIMYPNMTKYLPFIYDESGYFGNDKTFIITSQDDSFSLKALVAIFNSKFAKLWIRENCPELGEDRREIRKVYFENFPVPIMESSAKAALSQLADRMLDLHHILMEKKSRFLHRVKESLNLQKISAAMEDFEELDFKAFTAELKKQKIKLTLTQQDEWEEYFNTYKTECVSLKNDIAATDREIDNMVYALYGLTEEEKQMVEGN